MKLRFTRLRDEEGSELVEFSIVCFVLVMTVLTIFELSRMVLVYTDVANAATEGVRYAIVHGQYNPVTTDQIQAVVQTYMSSAPVNTASPPLTISVTYPDGNNNVGSHVSVKVKYAYDPLSTYFPLSVTLGSVSQGVIDY